VLALGFFEGLALVLLINKNMRLKKYLSEESNLEIVKKECSKILSVYKKEKNYL